MYKSPNFGTPGGLRAGRGRPTCEETSCSRTEGQGGSTARVTCHAVGCEHLVDDGDRDPDSGSASLGLRQRAEAVPCPSRDWVVKTKDRPEVPAGPPIWTRTYHPGTGSFSTAGRGGGASWALRVPSSIPGFRPLDAGTRSPSPLRCDNQMCLQIQLRVPGDRSAPG